MKSKIFKIANKVITIVLSIITVSLMLLAVYNFFSVKVLKKDYANIFGYAYFEVISGSMSPAIEKWDVIVVKLDTDYEVGDIVSFKSGDSFITHRIIEINGDTYVTKGDSNNTVDNPITKDRIAGKVVKVYSSAAAWIKVFTTPKVLIGAIISLFLIGRTLAMFKEAKEKEEKESLNLERGDIMSKIKENNRLKLEIVIFLILLAALLFLVPYTFSRFRTEGRGDVEVDIAFFTVNDQYTRRTITLTDEKPGDTYSYTFSVANNMEGNRSDVNQTYDIEILATTNLPLDYELELINDDPAVDAILSDTMIQDEDDTYFRSIKTSSRDFYFSNDYTDYYKLTVNFPVEYKNFKYQGVAENIEIRVNAKQVLDSDNIEP